VVSPIGLKLLLPRYTRRTIFVAKSALRACIFAHIFAHIFGCNFTLQIQNAQLQDQAPQFSTVARPLELGQQLQRILGVGASRRTFVRTRRCDGTRDISTLWAPSPCMVSAGKLGKLLSTVWGIKTYSTAERPCLRQQI
jgi:hypothetical protein